jgi:hypothetical protein
MVRAWTVWVGTSDREAVSAQINALVCSVYELFTYTFQFIETGHSGSAIPIDLH